MLFILNLLNHITILTNSNNLIIQKIQTQRKMNYESLYQQFKWKQFHEKQTQQNEIARIQTMCNEPKININSTSILLKRTIQILDQFSDEQLVNLQTSIPILQAVSILQLLKSVTQAKERLSDAADTTESRLRHEAEFLYHLWNLIDEEQIECRQLKQLIELLQSKKKIQLKFMLSQMYSDEQKVDNLVRSWTILTSNQQYYKHIVKPPSTKSYQSNKENNAPMHQPSFYYSKADNLNRSGDLGSPIHEKTKSSRKSHKNLVSSVECQDKQESNQFNYTCQLSINQERQLVDRLYKNDIYQHRQEQKKQRERQKENQQLKQCTFKPNLVTRGRSVNSKQHNQIRGYQKAINRLKAGNQKNKIFKQMREYKPVGQNYQKIKQKGINPPKFLQRKKKQEEKILFIISFDLGRHKTNVKIRQNDTEDTVAERICKIYSLKKQFYEEIKQIVRTQLETYYEQLEHEGRKHQAHPQQLY